MVVAITGILSDKATNPSANICLYAHLLQLLHKSLLRTEARRRFDVWLSTQQHLQLPKPKRSSLLQRATRLRNDNLHRSLLARDVDSSNLWGCGTDQYALRLYQRIHFPAKARFSRRFQEAHQSTTSYRTQAKRPG